MVTGNARPTERYGAPAPWVRPVIMATVVVVATAWLAWLLWAAFYHSNPQVASRLVSYDVIDAHHVDVTIEVDRAAEVTATCRVLAEASDHAIVGGLTFQVGPETSGATTGRVTWTELLTIETDREATTAVLQGCTTNEQHAPR
jgi:Domain of unknown function (DUF4307)